MAATIFQTPSIEGKTTQQQIAILLDAFHALAGYTMKVEEKVEQLERELASLKMQAQK